MNGVLSSVAVRVRFNSILFVLCIGWWSLMPVWADPIEANPSRSASNSWLQEQVTFSGKELLDDDYELLDIDTLFYVENQGLTRIFVTLNGHSFKLVTDPEEVKRSVNAFLIPLEGEITIHIGAYLEPGDQNLMQVRSQGPDGSSANLIIADLFLPGQHIAYYVAGLQPLPRQFELDQGYPNPFTDQVTIRFSIPDDRINGVPVYLAIYDVAGRLVRELVDDRRFPGTFTITWDGTDARQYSLASGVYLCTMDVEGRRRTMTVVKI